MKNLIDVKLAHRKKTKTWLAKHSGIHLSIISRVANQKRNPSLQTAHRIASVLDCFIEQLFILR